MLQSESNSACPNRVRGWILDLYPSGFGQMAVWVVSESGERVRLVDEFRPRIYVSGKMTDVEGLSTRLVTGRSIAASRFVDKYAHARDVAKSRVLEVEVKDCRSIPFMVRDVLEMGRYLRFQVHNCDLQSTQAYLYDRDVFPLAFVEVEVERQTLRYSLLDAVESVEYRLPGLRVMRVHVEIARKRRIASLTDPIKEIVVSQGEKRHVIDSGDERTTLLRFVKVVNSFDPDIVVTRGGDALVFPYLVQRAVVNGVLDQLVLSRDAVPLVGGLRRGKTFFSYGRTYYRAPTRRLYGRVHVDENNTFILAECGFDGLFEVARTCRVPLHLASRSSIGSSMASLQFYQAIKDEVLIPRNKGVPEIFKSAYELLVGDRGGFVYEPRMGIHDWVGEVDFASMYPSLMAKNNISAETVLCTCCPDSSVRVPDLGYHFCERRIGVVPKVLRLVIAKRLQYKRLRRRTSNPELRKVYDGRQGALKWILVTCFGYLGYRNAKFGTVDGHMGVCAFGRDVFLTAARLAERHGFDVVHGIVDSLWLKKEGAAAEDYVRLCRETGDAVGVPLSFEGRYKWIVFVPSRMHPNVAVLNRYYGVKENGEVKVRGLEVRRRDTPKLVHDMQLEMIKALAAADDSKAFVEKLPDALKVVREYRRRLIEGDVPVWDLIVTRRLSKDLDEYTQRVSQVIAAEQLLREGAQVSAGNNVGFLFTSAENKRYERRVKAKELIEEGTNSDVRKYLLLLYAAAANLLSPFGYSAQDVYHAVRKLRCIKLA